MRAFTVSKFLGLGITYPADFGFFPSTRAEDGDPLDLMLFHESATFPGLVLKVRPIGVLEVVQKEKRKSIRNDRVIAVPMQAERLGTLAHAKDLGREFLREVELFLRATDELQEKELSFKGLKGPAVAEKLIRKAAAAHAAGGD